MFGKLENQIANLDDCQLSFEPVDWIQSILYESCLEFNWESNGAILYKLWTEKCWIDFNPT